MQDKMLRFLKSIHIEDPERFDLDFDLASRDPFNPKKYLFKKINKHKKIVFRSDIDQKYFQIEKDNM